MKLIKKYEFSNILKVTNIYIIIILIIFITSLYIFNNFDKLSNDGRLLFQNPIFASILFLYSFVLLTIVFFKDKITLYEDKIIIFNNLLFINKTVFFSKILSYNYKFGFLIIKNFDELFLNIYPIIGIRDKKQFLQDFDNNFNKINKDIQQHVDDTLPNLNKNNISENEFLEFYYKIDFNTYKQFNFQHLFKWEPRKKIKINIFYLFISLFLFILSFVIHNNFLYYISTILLAIFSLLILTYFIYFISLKKYFTSNKLLNEEIHLKISNDKIKENSESFNLEINWDKIYKAAESDKLIALYTGKSQAIIIQKEF